MPDRYPFFFPWTDQRSAVPLEITGGEGAWFTTADGERWLDFRSMSYQANLGHGHQGVIDAVVRQAQTLSVATANAVFPAKLELAERLLALAPDGYTKVFFTLGGAEANENAVKMARMATGRLKTISRYRSYHGASMGALSLTGDYRRPPFEPGVPGAVKALDCYCDGCPFGKTLDTCNRECASHIGDVIQLESPDTVAAVILEPVVGANGVLVPPPEYWPTVRDICDRHGVLLIADEVLTGFGRTGRCFGVDHWGVVPDMITVAKGLTGGYAPLGAVLVHERVADHFADNVLLAGLTNYAHPLGCAAGVAAIDAYAAGNLFARAAELGTVLLDAVAGVRERHPDAIRVTRGLGLLVGAEVQASPGQWARLSAELRARRLYVFCDARRGLCIFAPPLVIEREDLEHGVALFEEALTAAMQETGG